MQSSSTEPANTHQYVKLVESPLNWWPHLNTPDHLTFWFWLGLVLICFVTSCDAKPNWTSDIILIKSGKSTSKCHSLYFMAKYGKYGNKQCNYYTESPCKSHWLILIKLYCFHDFSYDYKINSLLLLCLLLFTYNTTCIVLAELPSVASIIMYSSFFQAVPESD